MSHGMLWVGAVLFSAVSAQQFPLHVTSYDSLGLSSKCFEALNTTLECSHRLAFHVKSESSKIDLLDADGIEETCTEACDDSLEKLRAKIESDCDPAEDVLDHNLALYPATYIIDRYIYAYEISCYKNRDTGNFCDHVLGEWRNQTGSTPNECDDCVLGPMQIEVNSPIGHTDDRAADFRSAVSSCGVTGYAYTSPSPYVLSSTVGAPEAEVTVVPPQDWSAQRMSSACASTYRVLEGDTCDGICSSQSVSTKGLIEANDQLDPWCKGLEVGQDLCLPAQCKLHRLSSQDSCDSLLETYGASKKDLSKWNRMIYINCENLENYNSYYICVGPPAVSVKKLNPSFSAKGNSSIQATDLSAAKTSASLEQTSTNEAVESSTSSSTEHVQPTITSLDSATGSSSTPGALSLIAKESFSATTASDVGV